MRGVRKIATLRCDVERADGRVATEKFTRRLQLVRARRPCVVPRARPRAHVNYGQKRYSRDARQHQSATTTRPTLPHPPPGTGQALRSASVNKSRPDGHRTRPFEQNLAHKREGKRDMLVGRGVAAVSTHSSETAGQPGVAPPSSHEAALTTHQDMAPRRSLAATDDHPEASRGAR